MEKICAGIFEILKRLQGVCFYSHFTATIYDEINFVYG